MSRAAIHLYKLFGLMPIGDTPRMVGWWYHTDLQTKKRWYGALGGFDSEIGWGQYLERQAENVRKVEQAATDESVPVTQAFPPVQSDEQIVPIINSMVHDKPGVYQVNIPNRGPILPGFPEDLVVECEGIVSAAGIRGTVAPALPTRLMVGAMIPHWQRAEMEVEAIRKHDRELLLLTLLHDQRTRSLEQAEKLLGEWLADPRNGSVAQLFGQD